MAMNGDQLADEMAAALGYSPTSRYLKAFGNGIVEEVRNGTATSRFFPGPHSISGISAGNMANLIMSYAGYPFISRHLQRTCEAISDHVMQSGQVFYSAPPPSPDPANAWYLNGKISGLVGATLASMIASYVGYPHVSAKLLAESTAIVNHIMTNAEVTDGVIT